MSETTANRSRARRRVVRQAGPPVDGDGTAVEVREPGVSALSPEPVTAAAAEPSPAAEGNLAGATADAAADENAVDTAPAEDTSAAVAPAPAGTDDSAKPAESEGAESDGADEKPSRLRRITGSLGRMGTIAAVVAVISALVLIGSGGLFFYHQNRADALSERRAEYVQVAKQAYINMTNINDATASQDIDRMLSVTGGGLKDEFSQNRDEMKKFFEQLKVQSSGKIVAAAIESDNADSGSVLMLVQQTVSNVGTNGPMQRDYRVRVRVTRNGDNVSASSLEIVP